MGITKKHHRGGSRYNHSLRQRSAAAMVVYTLAVGKVVGFALCPQKRRVLQKKSSRKLNGRVVVGTVVVVAAVVVGSCYTSLTRHIRRDSNRRCVGS